MPLQELTPPPAVTGLSTLGNVFAGFGADQLARSRTLDDAERKRSQQLQDIDTEIKFKTGEAQKERDARANENAANRSGLLANEQAMATFRDRQSAIQILVNEGFLNGALKADEKAVADAFASFQQAGVDKQYAELWSTPDPATGAPLLTREQSVNPAAVMAAKDKLGAIKAKQIQFQMGQQGNAQATINQLNQQLAGIRQQKEAITRAANEPVRQVTANDQRVAALAAQLAEQTKPGSGRNREAVAAQIPIALKQLNDQAFIEWNSNIQSAKIELESLRRSETELTGALERAMGTFKIAPSNAGALTAPVAAPTASVAPKAATADDIAAAMRAVVGGAGGAASAPAGPSAINPFQNPTNNPVIAAGNDELQSRAQSELNAAVFRNGQIEQELASLSVPQRPSLGVGLGGMSVASVADPIAGATKATALLKAKAENDAKIRSLKAQQMGAVPAGVTAPAMNTATSSTPTPAFAAPEGNWWQASSPPPPGM